MGTTHQQSAVESSLANRAGKSAHGTTPRALIVKIHGLMPTLPPRSRGIANALLAAVDNTDANLSISAIAAAADASPGAVVKFAKRLGLFGYRELRATLVQHRMTAHRSLHVELSLDDDGATVVRKVFGTAIQALEDTLAIFDHEALSRAAAAMAGASTRLLLGVGGSSNVAADFEHKLMRIGLSARALADSHLMAMNAALLRKGDVVLAISHSGSSAALIDAVDLAKRGEATVIGLTNVRQSALGQRADILLVSASQGSPITGENAASRIAQLGILDALFVRIAQARPREALANLEVTMASVSQKRLA